jgi:hypothetical protein
MSGHSDPDADQPTAGPAHDTDGDGLFKLGKMTGLYSPTGRARVNCQYWQYSTGRAFL